MRKGKSIPRILSALLALTMVLALASCGDSGALTEEEYQKAVVDLNEEIIAAESLGKDVKNDLESFTAYLEKVKEPYEKFMGVKPPKSCAEGHEKIVSGCQTMIDFWDRLAEIAEQGDNEAFQSALPELNEQRQSGYAEIGEGIKLLGQVLGLEDLQPQYTEEEYMQALANLREQTAALRQLMEEADHSSTEGLGDFIAAAKGVYADFMSIHPPEAYAAAHEKYQAGCQMIIEYYDLVDDLAGAFGTDDAKSIKAQMSELLQAFSGAFQEGNKLLKEAGGILPAGDESQREENAQKGPLSREEYNQALNSVITQYNALEKEQDAADRDDGETQTKIMKTENALLESFIAVEAPDIYIAAHKAYQTGFQAIIDSNNLIIRSYEASDEIDSDEYQRMEDEYQELITTRDKYLELAEKLMDEADALEEPAGQLTENEYSETMYNLSNKVYVLNDYVLTDDASRQPEAREKLKEAKDYFEKVKAIEPPESCAAAHEKYLTGYQRQLEYYELAIDLMSETDQRKLDEGLARMTELLDDALEDLDAGDGLLHDAMDKAG